MHTIAWPRESKQVLSSVSQRLEAGVSAMQATDFEFRHQRLIHQFIVAAAFLTYLFRRDDIVWQYVKNTTAPHELERALFLIATLWIAAGAAIATLARAFGNPPRTADDEPYRYLRESRYLGDLIYSVGLASLAPLSGFLILVIGEALRIFRLMQREDAASQYLRQRSLCIVCLLADTRRRERRPAWREAFRQEAVKWGLLITMIVFVITLKDRLAEILAATSFLIGLLLNTRIFHRASRAAHSS